ADPDEFRSSFRAALAEQDVKRLRQLAEMDLGEQRATFVVVVGGVYAIAPDRRRALLSEAWQRCPNDFALAMERAHIKDERGRLTADQVAWYRTALALRPDKFGAWNNLGNCLKHQGDLDGAVAAYRQAIALYPRDALPHNGLGNALYAKNQIDAAIRE